MNKKVISKIKQLLSLAKNNNNLNEALTAAQTAARLCKEYNISEKMLDIIEHDQFIDYCAKFGRPWLDVRSPSDTFQVLASMIAEQNNCRCYLYPFVDENNVEFFSLSIVGSSANIQISEAIFWFIQSQLTSLSLKQNPQNHPSFWMGALNKLQERFLELQQEESPQHQQFAIQKINENKTKIDEYIKIVAAKPNDQQMIFNEKLFNLGYVGANEILIEDMVQLKE